MCKGANKFLLLILSFLMILDIFPILSGFTALAAAGTPDIGWYNNIDVKFEINTADQLAGLAQLVNNGTDNFGGKTITLTADIDLSAYGESWNNGKGWVPIGYRYGDINTGNVIEASFLGTFDGNNKIITGLYINDDILQHVGLFGFVSSLNATIKNLGVVDVDVTGNENTGGIAGYLAKSSVTNCYSIGIVNSTYASVGGVVGNASYDAKVTNCYFRGKVSSTYGSVGGVVGVVIGSVTNCYATGTVSCDNMGGGVVGVFISGVVKNCVALNSSIEGMDTDIGRVVGMRYSGTLSGNRAWNRMSIDKTIDKCDNTLDGADISETQAKTAVFWKTSVNWYMFGWNTAIWDIIDGRLPILKNVGGRQVTGIISITPDTEKSGVTVNLISPWQSGAVLNVAVYSSNKLLSMKAEATMQNGDMIISVAIPDNADIIKVMMWDGLNTMQPLCEEVTKKKDNSCDWITGN